MKNIFIILSIFLLTLSCSKEEDISPCQELRQSFQPKIDEAMLNGDLEEADGLRNRLHELLINRGCY